MRTSSLPQLRITHNSYQNFYFASIEVLLSLQANRSLAVLSSQIIIQICPFATAMTSTKTTNGCIADSSEQRLRAYNNEVQETYLHFAKDALWIPVKRYVILETSRLLRPASTPAAESSRR